MHADTFGWIDPRPDLANDHAFWCDVLVLLAARVGRDAEVFGSVLGLRCCGARLVPVAPGGVRMVKGEEMSEEEWQRYRSIYLMPQRVLLQEILRGIAHEEAS